MNGAPRHTSKAPSLSEREHPNGQHLAAGLLLPAELVEQVAAIVADAVSARLGAVAEPWMGVEASAEYIGAPTSRIYDLKKSGRLRFAKDGSRLLFRREWLDDCLDTDTPPQARTVEPKSGRIPAHAAGGR